MAHYSFEPRDRILVKGYRFLYFARKIDKNICKNINGKYSWKLFDRAN